jgi:NitT/TauT family transport system permease protein
MGNEKEIMKSRRAYIISALVIITIAYSLVFEVFNGDIIKHILISLLRFLGGYLSAIILGILIAIILNMNKYLTYAFKPLISFLISIPTITWVPLLLIITGISEKTIILTIFLGSFFAVLYNALEGFENIDQNLLKVGKTLGYSNIGLLLKVSLPASFNNILVGLKLGIAYSWRALVGAEMLGATAWGLGYLIFASRKFYNLEKTLLILFLIGLLGYLMNLLLVKFIENNTITKWGLNK